MNMDASTSAKVMDFIDRTGVPEDQAQTYIQLYEAVFVYNIMLTAGQTAGTATDYKATTLLNSIDTSVPIKGWKEEGPSGGERFQVHSGRRSPSTRSSTASRPTSSISSTTGPCPRRSRRSPPLAAPARTPYPSV